MDTSAGPYFEQDYPYNLALDYGRSDYNIGKSLKLFGLWQPVLFHSEHNWIEKIVGGWSLGPVFNIHSGFPWTPVFSTGFNGSLPGSLYCSNCGYSQLFAGSYLHSFGTSTSNGAFKGPVSSNFPLINEDPQHPGASAYFANPVYSPAGMGPVLPQSPGVRRGTLTLPGYKDLDLTIAKGFGLPNMRVLGENAKVEVRMDVYNVFNNLNFNPNDISNNVGSSNFGTITGALTGRVVVLGGRFSF
jgi:hypothetical protein